MHAHICQDIIYWPKAAKRQHPWTTTKLVLNFCKRVVFEVSDVDAQSKLIFIYYNNAINIGHPTVRQLISLLGNYWLLWYLPFDQWSAKCKYKLHQSWRRQAMNYVEVPIPKSNPPRSIESDPRPISLTSTLSKVLELFIGTWVLERLRLT